MAYYKKTSLLSIVLFVGGLVLSCVTLLQEQLPYTKDGQILFTVPAQKRNYQKAVLICLVVLLLILTYDD